MSRRVDADSGEEFAVRRVTTGSEVLIELIGELDIAGLDQLLDAARDLSPACNVTMDLSQLTFMDSTGIRAFMTLDLRSRSEQWSLTLKAAQPQVLNVLKVCGFDDRFKMIP